MELVLLRSLWGFPEDLPTAIGQARRHGFDGLEVNLRHPALASVAPRQVRGHLAAAGLELMVEVVTGGDYVPALEATPAEHLAELGVQLCECRALEPLGVNVIAGSDSWPRQWQQAFWEGAVVLAERSGLAVSFETHRSRSFAVPWGIGEWLETFPSLRLTADISHWCVVCERLMTPDLEPIRAMADRVDHIHARVGHAQGPQVAHPFAPEHGAALEAHRACWHTFVEARRRRGCTRTTFTPEFGPDGYMPTLPFTGQPVADLLEINGAMAGWLRDQFGATNAPLR